MRPTASARAADALRRATAGLLLATALCALPGDPAAAAPAADAPLVKVVVAVLPFRIHSARPLDYLEQSLPDLLATRLEASGRVEVLEALSVRETLIAHGDERTDDALRRLAEGLGADYVVAGSLTELAGRYSLDVRVLPVESRFAVSTFAFHAAGDDELLDRVDELADRVLELVGTTTPRTRVAGVRIVGVPEDMVADARAQLAVREGEIFQTDAAQQDLAALRATPGIGAATVSTERGPEGVVVTYRLVPAELLLPEPPTAAAGERVAEVVVRGNRRIEANAIRARITTQAGDRYDPARVAADVREVYALGFFRDVQVLSDTGPDGRVLTFEVRENPVVRQVSITGNESIDAEKIRETLTLTTGSTLDYPLLFENQERISTLYRAEGYYLAEVGYEIEPAGPEGVTVDFTVEEGKKLRLERIEFEGNEHLDDDELRRGMATKTWHWYSYVTRFLDRSGTYAEPVFLQDLQGVADKYLNAGYLKADIGEPIVDAREDGLVVRVKIDEGPQYKVGEVEVVGDDSIDRDALQDTLRLETGEVFDRSELTGDVERLEAHYTNRGFFFARVNPRTQPDDDELTVDVEFQVEKGPLHFIREIDIVGNTTTVDRVIRREIQLVEGQLYSQRAIELSRSRIRGLGFFEEVEFEPKRGTEPDELDLDVKVVEKPTGSLSFGAGYSSQDKFVVSGALSQSNLFGRGYAASASADLGGRSQRFFVSFTDPYFLDTTFALTTQVFQSSVDYEDFEQDQRGGEVALSHLLDERGESRGWLRYSFSTQEIKQDDNVNASAVIFRELLGGEESTSLIGLSLRSDNRDDRLAPSRGRVLGGSLEFAGLGGFSQFLRAESRGSWFFRPPGWFPSWFPWRDKSSFVLAARAGYALPFNDVTDFDFETQTLFFPSDSETQSLDKIDENITLPLSQRYFLGGIGAYQLRGFKARSVGPRRAILYRGGFTGGGDAFTPVGVVPNGSVPAVCADFPGNPFQGNGNGKCNSIFDEEDSDFDDLDETDVIGGNQFFSTSAEYRFPIAESLGLMGIVFLDMGNAFDEEHTLFDVSLWRYGTGFGVQWFSPFGPLQAFLGFPIDRLEVEDTTVFEFWVGGAAF